MEVILKQLSVFVNVVEILNFVFHCQSVIFIFFSIKLFQKYLKLAKTSVTISFSSETLSIGYTWCHYISNNL